VELAICIQCIWGLVLDLFDLQGNGETTNLENGTNRTGPNERGGVSLGLDQFNMWWGLLCNQKICFARFSSSVVIIRCVIIFLVKF
jgi:hypothetical protein